MAASMTPFERNILWRLVAPLVVASIIAAGANILATARVSTIVDRLESAQKNMATKEWVGGRLDFIQYQIDQLKSEIRANAARIQSLRNQIKLQRSDNAAWRPPQPSPRPQHADLRPRIGPPLRATRS